MPTTIITGRDITFTIDGDSFDAQATSATLTVDSTVTLTRHLMARLISRQILREHLPWRCWPIGVQLDHFVKLCGHRRQARRTLAFQLFSERILAHHLRLMSSRFFHLPAVQHRTRRLSHFHLLA